MENQFNKKEKLACSNIEQFFDENGKSQNNIYQAKNLLDMANKAFMASDIISHKEMTALFYSLDHFLSSALDSQLLANMYLCSANKTLCERSDDNE